MISHSILSSPFSGSGLKLCLVSLVDLSDLRHQRVIWVRVRQQGADREEHLGDGKGRRPLVLENIKADATVRVDVGVVDPGGELHLGRLEGVVGRERDVQEKQTAYVRRVIGAHDSGLPLELVLFVGGASGAVSGRVLA